MKKSLPIAAVFYIAVLLSPTSRAQNLYVGSNAANVTTNFTSGTNAFYNTYVGYTTNATNNLLNIFGAGTLLGSENGFFVGFSGSGNQLVVSNGGTVRYFTGGIGENSTANNNTATVTGAGSLWTAQPELMNYISRFYVGRSGSGNQLVVSNGGTVINAASFVGFDSTANNNTVTVTGAGSLWTTQPELMFLSSFIVVGGSGSGNQLVVSNGGTVRNSSGDIGYTGNNNTATVTGAGSLWSNSSTLTVGVLGTDNTLTVAAGGSVAASGLVLAESNGSSGTLNIGRFGTNDAGGTIIAPTIAFGAGNGRINFNQSNAVTITSVISGAGTVRQLGSGTTTLSGANTYSGTTAISAGTLLFSNTNSLYGGNSSLWTAANLIVSSNATAAFGVGGASGFTTSNVTTLLGNLTTVNNNGLQAGSSIGFDTTGGNFTLTNNIANSTGAGGGSLGLTKLGSGTLILSGSNSYGGTTTVAGGTLQVTNLANAGTSSGIGTNATIILINGGTLDYAGTTNTAMNRGINLASGAGEIGVSNTAAAVTISSVISNSGTLVKSGAGTLILRGANNTYTGGTTINAGTVAIGNGSSFGAGTVTFGSNGATVAALASMQVNNNYALIGNGTMDVGAVVILPNPNEYKNVLINSGVISGAGSLTKAGVGTVILAGANTYSGNTTISAGTLQINAGGSVSNSATTLVGSGGAGTLSISGGTYSNTSVSIGHSGGTGILNLNSGSLSAQNLAVSGNGAVAGTLNLNGGTMAVSGSFYVASGGTINVNSGGVLSGGNGAQLWVDATNSLVNFNGGTGSSGLNLFVGNGGTVDLRGQSLGSNNWANLVASGLGGVLRNSGTNAATIANPNTIWLWEAGQRLTIDASGGDILINSWITSSQMTNTGIIKTGTNALILANSANDYNGGSFLQQGTLRLDHANAAGSGAITQSNAGSTLQINATGTVTNAMSLYNIATLQTVTLSGAKTLNGATYTVAADTTTTESGVLSGAGGLTKSGAGTMTLSASNTYTGDTTISAGALALSNTDALSGSTLDYSSAGTISFGSLTGVNLGGLQGSTNLALTNATGGAVALNVGANSSNTTYSGILSGAGSLTKAGAGTMVLGAANTYSGGTTINAGTVVISNGSSFGSNTVTLGSNGTTVAALASMQVNNNYALIGNGTMDVGRWNFIGDNIIIGDYINEFVLVLTNSGVISGAGSLTKAGAGTMVLGAANTYTGGTTINEGTVAISNGSSFGSNTVTFASNGTTVAVLASVQVTNNYALTGNGTMDVGANILTNSGVISGAGSLTKAGAGTMVLGAANTYTGGTTINAGTLALGSANRLADTGAITVNGGIFDLGGFSETVGAVTLTSTSWASASIVNGSLIGSSYDFQSGNVSASLAGNGVLAKTGAGTTTLTGANTYTGGTVISAGALLVGNGGTTGTLGSGAVSNNASLIMNRSDAVNLSNVISGTGGFTQAGAGTTTLNGNNSYSGGTTINAGTVAISNGSSFGSNTVTFGSNGTRVAALASMQVNNNYALIGNGTMDVGANVLTNSGVISGAGSLTKAGAGTMVLSGSNSFTGTTTISAGVLALSNTDALSGSTLDYSSAGTISFGSLTEVNLGGLQGSTNLALTNASGGAVALNVGANSNNTTYSGFLSGAGSLTKSGTGTMTLSASNTYTGDTAIGSGVLALTNGSAIADTAAVTNSGATLRVDSSETIGSLRGSGSTVLNGAAVTLTVAETNSQTYAGVISGAGGFAKAGIGTVTFTGANTYSGDTTINAGVLQINVGGAVSNSANIYVGKSNSGNSLVISNGGRVASVEGSIGYAVFSSNNSALVTGANSVWTNSGYLFYVGRSGSSNSLVVSNGGTVAALIGQIGAFGSSLNNSVLVTGAGSLWTNRSELYVGWAGSGNSLVISNGGTVAASSSEIGYSYSINNSALVTGAGSLWTNSSTLTVGPNNTNNALTVSDGGTLAASAIRIALNTGSSGTLNIGRFGTNDAAGTITAPTIAFSFGTGTINFNQSDSTTLSAAISGNGAVNQLGTGTTTLSGANTYTGGTAVSAGSLVGTTTSLQGAIANNAAVTFDQSTAGTYSGAMSGSGSLTKLGAGTLILTASNSYAGGTLLNAGALAAGNAFAFGTGSITLTNSTVLNLSNFSIANLIINNGGILTNVGTVSGAELNAGTTTLSANNSTVAEVSGTAAVTVAGNNTTITNVLGGTVSVAGTNTTVQNLTGGTINVTNGTTVNVQSGSTAGSIAGGGGLVKSGANTLTLSSANTFSGGTLLLDGTLAVASANALGSGSLTQTNGSSVLVIDTTGTVTNQMSVSNLRSLQTVTLSGNKTLNNATYDITNNTTTTESGTLSGSGGITKLGTGTLVVTASNTFTGAVDVQAGLLDLNSATGSAAGGTTSVAVASGATLLISQNNQVNNAATVSLSGGTIRRGGNVGEVFGDLTVSAASFLDYGAANDAGTIRFGTYAPSALLTVQNFLPGNKLQFGNTISSTDLSNTSLFQFSNGFATGTESGFFTITAIPEPSTYIAALGMLALMLWPLRRRRRKSAKISE